MAMKKAMATATRVAGDEEDGSDKEGNGDSSEGSE